MKIVFWGNGNRGVRCLQALHEHGYVPDLVMAHPSAGGQWYESVVDAAERLGIRTLQPEDPNAPEVREVLADRKPDLFVLAGYGRIFRKELIGIPTIMCINLHAGKLPDHRGSSPLNWALINGEPSFTLSVIRVNTGVDAGDVLLERTFDIAVTDTIRDLHRIANESFPSMLLEVIRQIESGFCRPRAQDSSLASYYPLRFPDDGLILWDLYTAEQIHNRIRALTEPYPGAFTFFAGKKVKLLASALHKPDHYGEPGRVYRKTPHGILVCARDRCLWISKAVFAADGTTLFDKIQRYDRLATVKAAAQKLYESAGSG